MKTLRNHTWAWAVLLGLCCLALLAGPVWAAKSAEAERFDVDLTVNSDGSVQVSETLVFRYSGGPFTFVKRDIPATYTDGLRFVSAGMDGKNLPAGSAAGQVEVSGSDPLAIAWHFAGVSDSSHTFTLVYQALGVVQKTQAADVLVYTPLPRKHDYPIRSSTLRVRYPAGARLQGQPGESNGRARVETGSGLVTFTSGALGADETLEVRLEFAPGSLTQNTPAWQADDLAREELDARMQPVWFGGSLALLLGGGAALWTLRRRSQPEAAPGLDGRPSAIVPSNLPPALAGTLVSGRGDTTPRDGLTATLFDLARRGVITLQEQPKSGWPGGKDFLVQIVNPLPLLGYEQTLLETLFATRPLSVGMSVSLQEGAPRLAQNWNAIAGALQLELELGGWIDAQRKATARRWNQAVGLGLVLVLMGCGAAFFVMDAAGIFVLLPIAALLVLVIAGAVVARGLPHLSDRGLVEAARWKAFRDYLRQVSRGREPVTRPDLFEAYLPYAAAFSMASAWAGFFNRQGILPVPGWFSALQSGDSDYERASFMGMLDTSYTSSGSSDSSSDSGSSDSGGGGDSAGGGDSSTG